MTRRRADTPNPYDGIPSYDLSEAQRIDAQAILVERFHGRKDRAAWDRRYCRGQSGRVFPRARIVRERTGSQRGSLVWRTLR